LPRWYPHRYDPMPGLFIERHARSVAEYMRVGVLYIHQDDQIPSGKKDIVITRDEELLQVRIYFGEMTSHFSLLRQAVNMYWYLRCHLKGLKIIKKELGRPDLIHVNVLTRLGVLAMLYKWFTGTPYVITEHWTRYLTHMDNFKGRLRKYLTRKVVRNASAVLPVTDNLRMAMESHRLINDNYRIIPNVVDMQMFRMEKDEIKDRSVKHFIHVSCFEDKQKNISGILRVLNRLSEKRTDWDCTLIGDGIHFEKLKDYARELGIEGKFAHFTGLRENEELSRLMREADFQVLFSRFENLPVVILESYACGVPVLSTDVGGIKEHMNPDLGVLIQSENEEELEEKINYLLDHSQEYLKEKLRAYAETHFSKEVIGKHLAEVYTSIIQTKN
jgi:glycosyltransferase involved in cell wall biosynthesis